MNIKNIRQNNGITMVALVITIILLLILSGISITGVIRGVDETQEASQFSQLNMIQHTLLERKTKAQFTKEELEELPGTEISEENLEKVLNEIKEKTNQKIILKGKIQDYKELNTTDLENLGISKDNDTYIVNYKTGEVINKTKLTTKSGKILYTYSE